MNKTAVVKLISTWFYTGLAPKAPGTFGSLMTLPFVYFADYYGGMPAILIFAAVSFIIGIWAADTYAKAVQVKDPGFIVIDEVAGQSLTLWCAGLNPWLYLIGFALFRLFDISKPWPVSWADTKVKGGLGIMLDDVFAGIMGGAVLYLIKIYMF